MTLLRSEYNHNNPKRNHSSNKHNKHNKQHQQMQHVDK